MSLTTIEQIEEYLGTTLDSAETITYQTIIDAVSAWVSCHCDSDFTDQVIAERISICDGNFNVRNNVQYIYQVNSGIDTLIDITGTTNTQSIEVKDGTLSLISMFSKTDIDYTALTISQLVALIDAESGWTATIDADIVDTYALALYNGNYNLDDDFKCELLGANNQTNASRLTNRLFQASGCSAGEGVAIYQSGFAVVPDDLADAVTRMVIQAYDDRNPASGVSGDLKSEKLGDYSYSRMTASELNASMATLSIDYQDVLECYCNYSI